MVAAFVVILRALGIRPTPYSVGKDVNAMD
jgi:hypothetical protein